MKLLFSILCSLIGLSQLQQARAQAVISKLSFNNALLKAGDEGKVLMVVMDSKFQPQANVATSEALRTQASFTINQQAIIIRPATTGAEWQELVNRYYQEPAFQSDAIGCLFFNSRGEMVHRYYLATNDPHAYFNEAFLARRLAAMPNEKAQYDSVKASGYTDIDVLNRLLENRKERSEATGDLLEEFLLATPIDSFKRFSYFQALARLCPILHSRADSILLRSNFGTNWNLLEANERAGIYHTINDKTYEKAIATKDYALASYLIDSTDNNNLAGVPERDKSNLRLGLMSNYYHRVNDTVAYLNSATAYVDNYLMKISVDSVRKDFEKSIEALKERGEPFLYKTNGPAAIYASQLNFNAWEFYKMTRDAGLLQKALGWIRRAVEFNSTPEDLGACALLLYVTGNKKEAINMEKKTIRELKDVRRFNDVQKCELILDRMKKDAEKVDE